MKKITVGNALLSIICGFFLMFTSFLGLLYVNDLKIPFLIGKKEPTEIIEMLKEREISVMATADCPFPISGNLKATLQYNSDIWLTIDLYDGNTGEKLLPFLKSLNLKECEAISFEITNNNFEFLPLDVFRLTENDWSAISSIHKKKKSLAIEIRKDKFDEFDGHLQIILQGINSRVSYSLQELIFSFILKNGDGEVADLKGLIAYQRKHQIESIVPQPMTTTSYNILNEMSFGYRKASKNKLISIIQVLYSDRERNENSNLWVIILSTFIGIGSSAIFQGLLEYLRKEK